MSDSGTRYVAGQPAASSRPGARVPAAGRPDVRPASPGPLRLTRRGRLVLGAVVIAAAAGLALLLSLTLAGGALASRHGTPGAGYQGMRRVVVEPGQTLWSIAAAAEPTVDPRLVIPQIMTANSLSAATIFAGEQLWVPGR